MKMKLIIVLLFAVGFANAQTMQKYKGPFQNAENEPGEASYSYYVNAANGKQVKNGPFRYKVKIKKDDLRVYRNIVGEYKSGWKNGTWEYTYTTKDKREKDGYYYSYNVSLVANYDDGWPNGEWYYTSSIKRRRDNVIKGVKTWLPFEDVDEETMKVNFKYGMLVDSTWNKGLHTSFSLFADQQGFVQGEFVFKTDTSLIEILYKDGFSVSNNAKNSDLDIQKYEYQYYLKYKDDLKAHGVYLDTASLTYYSKSLDEGIYNDKYFNYRFIDGDRMVTIGPRKQMKVRYMGSYKRMLNVYLSDSDKLKIQGIYAYQISVSREVEACEKLYKDSENDITIRKKLEQLKAIENMIKTNACLVQVFKTKVSPYGITKASKSCKSNISFSESETREQILDKILNNAKELEAKAKAIECK